MKPTESYPIRKHSFDRRRIGTSHLIDKLAYAGFQEGGRGLVLLAFSGFW